MGLGWGWLNWVGIRSVGPHTPEERRRFQVVREVDVVGATHKDSPAGLAQGHSERAR